MDVKNKGIFRRMFDLALNEISRRSGPDEGAARESYGSEEPARAPSPLHPDAQHGAPSTGEQAHSDARPAPSEQAPSAAPQHSSVVFVHGDGGSLRVRWRIAPEHVQRASALVGDTHVPCLRLIFFSAADADVTREVQDRPNVGIDGECDVRDEPERLIATYGLRAGEKFVSVAHAVL